MTETTSVHSNDSPMDYEIITEFSVNEYWRQGEIHKYLVVHFLDATIWKLLPADHKGRWNWNKPVWHMHTCKLIDNNTAIELLTGFHKATRTIPAFEFHKWGSNV